MKKIIYLYILETMAEWEVGNILQGISMESMLKNQNVEFEVKTVSIKKNPIKTIGGLRITPDCTIAEIDENNIVALLLPGATTWNSDENNFILQKALEYIENGILVGAICGATLALANLRILERFKHTSNSLEYLNMFSNEYNGRDLYVESVSVIDRNLVTASSAGGLLWARNIMEYLNVYENDILDSWYNYYLTGNSKYLEKLLLK